MVETEGGYVSEDQETLALGGDREVFAKGNSRCLMDKEQEMLSPGIWQEVLVVEGTNQQVCLDSNWRFYLGDLSEAAEPYCDDSQWQVVDLPHDFSIGQDYHPNGESESGYKLGGIGWYRKVFSVSPEALSGRVSLHIDGAYMETTVFINGHCLGMHPYGYTPFSFDLTDYLMANEENSLAIKVVNAVPSSRWYSGSGLYRSVTLIVEPIVHLEEYGITITTPHLEEEIRANKEVTIMVVSALRNDGNDNVPVTVDVSLFEQLPNGELIEVGLPCLSPALILAPGEGGRVSQVIKVPNLILWNPEQPQCYTVRVRLYLDGVCIQSREQETGFRYLSFYRETGFRLNDKAMTFKGVCLHHDQGSLGAAAYPDAIERQFKLLKNMGVNSIRVTHNPSARVFKDLANKLGLLLIEEAFDTWQHTKNGNVNDYAKWFHQPIGQTAQHLHGAESSEQEWHDFHLKQMVKSGQNDPAIVMWSVGNELLEGHAGDCRDYPGLMQEMARVVTDIDGSRPVTFGDNKLKWQDETAIQMAQTLHEEVQGIIGYNYASGAQYDDCHKTYPNWLIYGSEVASAINSRGVYDVMGGEERKDKQLTSYDQSTVSWGHLASEAWYDVVTRDFVMGQFVWCGFDYLGEPTPWNGIGTGSVTEWPSPKHSYFGILDTAGFPKDSYYFYRSQWNTSDTTLHVLPVWQEGLIRKDSQGLVEVVVYSNAAKVRLCHQDENGTVIDYGTKAFTVKRTKAGVRYQLYEGTDKQPQAHQNLYLTWNIPYAPGKLIAMAYDANDNVIKETVGRSEISTFGDPHHLRIEPFTSPHQVTAKSLRYLTITIEDDRGQPVASTDHRVTVQVEGPARLLAMDNGNTIDHQPYGDTNRRAFSGQVLAVIKMTGGSGDVNVTAMADGLLPHSLTFTVSQLEEAKTSSTYAYQLSRQILLLKDSQLTLPQTIRIRTADGTVCDKPIVFEQATLDKELKQGKDFIVYGKVDGLPARIPVIVTVMDKVIAARNISFGLEVGEPLHLPQKVGVYDKGANLLSAQFPVAWQVPNGTVWNTEGIKTVDGQVDVLGQQLPVMATVRVASKTLHIDHNVAPTVVQLTDDSNVNTQIDCLQNLVREQLKEDIADHQPLWSNEQAVRAGLTTSKLTFSYDTAQNVSRVVIFFDGRSESSLPRSVCFSWRKSDTGPFEIISVSASQIPIQGGLIKVIYDLERPVPAVQFTIHLEAAEQRSREVSLIRMAKIELYTAIAFFERQTSAALTRLTIGNHLLEGEAICHELRHPDWDMTNIVATSDQNAAITVLHLDKKTSLILTTSEDGRHQERYVIYRDERSD
ncbi:glycoside hydrolase family 2 TIM barrel-domain containing protein [Streptococcus sp. S784/96/1]|uniref:glycoside hydrolase family 2 TIM barrel-domain containing protein n=1 Tax=Streptococcus sp. S784/96/1 TaxID=2653499 RepID=UPI00138999B8|nr:glycoside hydrolase family 2 TIM barrel-domain containing protein [Streptococcus sp. S784/96/1]